MKQILNCKSLQQKILTQLQTQIQTLNQQFHTSPHLALIQVGDNPGSEIYLKNKKKICQQIGITSTSLKLDSITPQDLMLKIKELNEDLNIHGILIQLPLPQEFNEQEIIESIDPMKDVDGLHPLNIGRLWNFSQPYFFPCTPLGIYRILKEFNIQIESQEVVILGRSNLVGKPMLGILSQKFPHANYTAILCHSQTKNLIPILQKADLIISAIGQPKFLKKEFIKPGVTIIDVGISRIIKENKNIIVGDADFDSILPLTKAITPVPGGVGLMTIASLMENTIRAFVNQKNQNLYPSYPDWF